MSSNVTKSRKAILYALNKITQKNSYSNLVIDSLLKNSDLTSSEKAFATMVIYGVIERKITLDYIIEKYCKIKKTPYCIVNVLRMGIYELKFLNSSAEYATVSQCVELAKENNQKTAGLVNGVLHNFLRDGKKIFYPKDKQKKLSIKYSCPMWIIENFKKDYGAEKAVQILELSLQKPPTTIKVNTLRITPENLIDKLSELGIKSKKVLFDDCIEVESPKAITATELFKTGMFHIQDVASQVCAKIVSSFNPLSVIDVCAAPGGKSFSIAQALSDNAQVYSFDLHQSRVNLIQSGANKLGLNNIKAMENDGTVFNDKINQADAVLCDVPCFGLGVIRRKPEIKYKPQSDLSALTELQFKILSTSSKYVKKNGILVYSTCSLSKEENQNVTERFLMANQEFKPEKIPEYVGEHFETDYNQMTLLPNEYNTDGFYICVMRKVGD